MIGRDTVEEIIYRRAASKLRLTNAVVEGGQFALGAPKPQGTAELQVNQSYILNFTPVTTSEMSQDVSVFMSDLNLCKQLRIDTTAFVCRNQNGIPGPDNV